MYKRADGRWQETLPIVVNGQKKTKFFYGRTKREVLEKINQYEEEQEQAQKFGAIAQEWRENYMEKLDINTKKSYYAPLRRAMEFFGDWKISDIEPVDINGFLLRFVEEMHPAKNTASTQRSIINMVFKYAVAHGYTRFNACRDIEIPAGLPKSKHIIASDDDIKRVIHSTECTFGMFAYWVLYTGLRRSELLALRWEDVDFEKKLIYVTKSRVAALGVKKIKKPKTEAGTRPVPLLKALEDKIIDQKGKGLIFPDDNGKLMTDGVFGGKWATYAQESGVACTPHPIRHAYATLLYEEDVRTKDAQKLLGHAQESTTKDIYTHIRDVQASKVNEQLRNADYAFETPKRK
uniref:Integrase n=1 Tax=Siphoviridae sp. ct8Cp41 TaxID=2825358 RepID=A0A8S5UB00_9CAUD|nr:MAG TPA: Integrase [Siphoviridae sp. ct8Cp41]